MGVDRAGNFALGRSPAGVDVKLPLRRSDRACACVMLFLPVVPQRQRRCVISRACVAPKDVAARAAQASSPSRVAPALRLSAPHGQHNALPTAG